MGEIKKIACVVGRYPVTDHWDQALVDLVSAWQRQEKIEPDGRVWRSARSNTWPVILAAFENGQEVADVNAARLLVGVWIDDAPKEVAMSAYADKLAALGIGEAALMLNESNTTSQNPPWRLRWNMRELVAAANGLQAAGIDVVLTAWPRPDPRQIDEMCDDLKALYEATGAAVIEMDTERNWTDRFVDGCHAIDQASTYLHDKLRTIAPAARLALTTHPFHAELKGAPSLSRLVDDLLPQAYSRYKGGEAKFGWNEIYGPWGMQRLAIAGALSIASQNPNMPKVVLGLPAWDQEFPGFLPEEAMQRAVDAATSLGVDHIRYWSSKWIVGKHNNEYASAFIRGIPKKKPVASAVASAPIIEVATGPRPDAAAPSNVAVPDLGVGDIPIFDLVPLQVDPSPKCKIVKGEVVVRDPATVTGIVIHQTACEFGVSAAQIAAADGDRDEAQRRRALNVACHALAFRKGSVALPHALLWYVNQANGFNPFTLGLEIEGNYPGLMSKPTKTTWGGHPSPVTDTVVAAARAALRYLVEEGRRQQLNLQFVYAHRQSSPTRTNDPGEELWRRVVLEYAVPVLGLKTDTGKVLTTRKGPGRPVPKEWDPNGLGRF